MSIRESATDLARRGFYIFRLHPRGNTPADEGWQQEATNNPDLVQAMWTGKTGKELPWNIGIATGRVLPSGKYLTVLDVDTKDGKEGDKSLAMLEAIYEEVKPTLRTRSSSGGWHLLLETDEPLRNSVSKLAPGLDVRGLGGYVVGAGSTRNGRPYEIVEELPIAAAPSFLRDVAPQPPKTTSTVKLDTTEAIARATDYIERSAPEAVAGDGGNNQTYKVAARIVEFGVAYETGIELMRDWNEAKAFPAWDDDDLEKIVRSAYNHAQNAPGSVLAENEFDPVAIKERLKGGIELEPIVRFDALDIPKRQWVLGSFAAKQYLSGLVSPPGVGKTTFLLMVAVAVATGREDILNMKVHQRGRVLLWNQEDETNELKRRLLAVMQAFDVKWEDIEIDGKPGIIFGSGVDRRMMFAVRNNNGSIVPAPDAKAVEDYIRSESINVAIFDPFVEMHAANENDNPEVAVVGAVFRRVAVTANCAVILAHHTRKPPAASASDAYAGNMDTSRGAGSLNGVARMVATLYSIDATTGKKYGISEDECRRYIRFDDAKANMSLVSGEPMFFRREGVTIGGVGGEEVGVLRPVELSRSKDAKTAARDDLVADVFECMGDVAKMPVTDMARALQALPTRADENSRGLEMAIKRAFETAVENDKCDIRVTTSGKRIILERREKVQQSCNTHVATEAFATVATPEFCE